ncbi:hypothetical protein DFH09DRAFT_1306513 [Mycena vulgaris]|nr:hypothetical protein DFH09DRAFT_1306513 [Mycena vulgaris]
MSDGVYCDVPRYDDAGVPVDSMAKLYLVTGANVEYPGAYASWPAADAMYKKSAGSTLKGYTHGALDSYPDSFTILSVPRPFLTLGALRSCLHRQACSPPRCYSKPQPITDIDSHDPCAEHPHFSQAFALRVYGGSRWRAYAVWSRGVGQVYDEYGPARNHFHTLQHLGECPVLFVSTLLTAAVCFVERGPNGGLPDDMEQRRAWIVEEKQAREVARGDAPSLSDEDE